MTDSPEPVKLFHGNALPERTPAESDGADRHAMRQAARDATNGQWLKVVRKLPLSEEGDAANIRPEISEFYTETTIVSQWPPEGLIEGTTPIVMMAESDCCEPNRYVYIQPADADHIVASNPKAVTQVLNELDHAESMARAAYTLIREALTVPSKHWRSYAETWCNHFENNIGHPEHPTANQQRGKLSVEERNTIRRMIDNWRSLRTENHGGHLDIVREDGETMPQDVVVAELNKAIGVASKLMDTIEIRVCR